MKTSQLAGNACSPFLLNRQNFFKSAINSVGSTGANVVLVVVVGGVVEGNVCPGKSVGLKVVAGTGATVVVDVRSLSLTRSICAAKLLGQFSFCLLYTSPSPRDGLLSRMPSSA